MKRTPLFVHLSEDDWALLNALRAHYGRGSLSGVAPISEVVRRLLREAHAALKDTPAKA